MDKSKYVVADLSTALIERNFPTITYWNRLEGRPRADNFDRALRAEVRDALWMLCKQWQMAEFRGDDAGSPVFGKVHLAHTRLTKYQPGADLPVQDFDTETPLEAKVEQRPISFHAGSQKMSLDLRLQMGRQWLKMLDKAFIANDLSSNYANAFINKFQFETPDPEQESDALVCAHREVWQHFAAVAGRSMDGGAFFNLLGKHPADWTDEVAGLLPGDVAQLKVQANKFIAWFKKLYLQPQDPEENAWKPANLEYQFACSAPDGNGEKVLSAEEYYHGRLDWYNFDIDTSRKQLDDVDNPAADPQGSETYSFMPAPISFAGMPNTRWWTFEDGKTNFGDIKPGTDEIAKLLLMEFGLVYANDWFLLPYTVESGSIANVRGLAVTNVFGERFWIEPSGKGDDEDFLRWNMYTMSIKGRQHQSADLSLLVLPTVPKIQEGKPLEEIALIRDEMANMVWGVETLVPLPDGSTKRGSEAATETLQFYKKRHPVTGPPAVLLENDAKIRYEAMNGVPENWIPFPPVHLPDNNREIQLQRSSMLRIFEGAPKPYKKVKPRTALLREGLDNVPLSPYFVHEEEVPRAGVYVTQAFQRTRWLDGSVFTWVGVRKKTGRGEGTSGLAFDQTREVRGEK
ncbi:MAG TPA: hypothetical protein PLO67_10660 [Saprospiraceae bacterium]|nr:hypothetical protein [Saprospiraceae bacterium]HPI06585.1 hypothetical protein [Saprospiraceae bacterium]